MTITAGQRAPSGSTAQLTFDVRQIPFSVRGAWINLSPVTSEGSTSGNLHLVAHQRAMTPVLELIPLTDVGAPAQVEVVATPSLLEWCGAQGRIQAVFESPETIRIRGNGLGLRIRDGIASAPFAGSHFFTDPVDGSPVFSSNETGRRYRVTRISGVVRAGADGVPDGRAGAVAEAGMAWEIAVEEFGTAHPAYRPGADFEAVQRRIAAEFAAYVDAIAPWRSSETPAAELAAYVLWSATVRPLGFLRRESVLMSKHWMDKVWSWDHCFNALALAAGLPDAALDQFLVVFDQQDESGALPDLVGHSLVSYGYVKPPVHGWTFARLRPLLPTLASEQIASIYERLARLTEFWLTARRAPGHRLPYYQHGNDSGWDNSTIFDGGTPVASPDLAALLVLQLDLLAGLADELGDGRGDGWRHARDDLAAALVAELWRGEDFIAADARSGAPVASRSLLRLMPIVAWRFLDEKVTAALVRAIRAHLTPHGAASEPPGSPAYQADGYWRGPIWAPPTVLIEHALRGMGEVDLADEISASFRRLCERSGFAENFDALTGEGLRDRAYTWTASCYLLLAGGFARRRVEWPISQRDRRAGGP